MIACCEGNTHTHIRTHTHTYAHTHTHTHTYAHTTFPHYLTHNREKKVQLISTNATYKWYYIMTYVRIMYSFPQKFMVQLFWPQGAVVALNQCMFRV